MIHMELISIIWVEDNFEYPHKSDCRNKLAVLYSYDNKSCVDAKHIVIKIEFMLWTENIQDQIISLEQIRICRSANQRLTVQCVQRTTVDMGFMVKSMILGY
jgi:hypothetical protein